MTHNPRVIESVEMTEISNYISQNPVAFRLAPTIGDQQAQIARETFRRTMKRTAESGTIQSGSAPVVEQTVTIVRQEVCPYCRSMDYEVSYRSASGTLQIKGFCSDCGYRAQSLRGGRTSQH